MSRAIYSTAPLLCHGFGDEREDWAMPNWAGVRKVPRRLLASLANQAKFR